MTRAADEAVELAFAHGLPFAGLRDEHHDASLVPEDAARAARVVALRASAGGVRLAAADPEPDLAAIRAHLGERAAEIVIAPRDEIDAILGPPPPPPAPPPDPAPTEPEPVVPAAAPEPAATEEPAEEPSWLTPEPARRGPALLALVAIAIVLLAAGAALAVWLST